MTESRETAGLTMRLLIDFVRREYGEVAVARTLEMAGETRPLTVLEDEKVWSTYNQKIALFEAAEKVTGRPDIGPAVGRTVLQSSVGNSLKIALGLLGSPATLLKGIARANGKFSTAGDMTALEVKSGSAVLRYKVRDGYRPHRLDCGYTIGLLTQVTALFDLPPARVDHPHCQVLGDEACIYQLSWQRRARLPWSRRRRSVAADALLVRLRELQATLSDLVATTDVDEVLDAIAARAGSAINAERFVLAVRLSDDDDVRVRQDGFEPDEADRVAADLLRGRRVDLDGHGRLIAEVRTSTRSYGKLAAFSRDPFLEHEADLLDAYVGLAATALEAVTSVAEAEEGRQTAEGLLALAGELHRAESREAVADAIATAVRAVVGADFTSVLLFAPDGSGLRVAGQSGISDDIQALLRHVLVRPADTPQLARLLDGSAATCSFDRDGEDRYVGRLLQAFRASTAGAVAIQGNDGPHGVLIAGWTGGAHHPHPNDDDFAKLQALADQGTNALDKTALLEQVRHQAASDALTGIANRRVLGERLEDILTGAPPDPDAPPALLFLDLDGFKRVNDTLGHAAGDELLRTVASRLRQNVWSGDTVARLGGDEFTVLLSSTHGAEAAVGVAERLLAGLSGLVTIEGSAVEIRASVGVVVLKPGQQTASDVLRAADAAMYAAKKLGGNRCFIFPTDPGLDPIEESGTIHN
ncbi:MAG TPA: sensor domain-containing diguanylate cyclase [Acidimicrobiales bacterium]|jgi:diguanylate cyclase (GGDEF)-like protein|nr:sensor domain-containing diguanylate cyclase [Acidimicrobiales bacterium]